MGLTQSEVAQRAHISVRSYQNYEWKKRIPNAYTAQKIANILETTVEELFKEPK